MIVAAATLHDPPLGTIRSSAVPVNVFVICEQVTFAATAGPGNAATLTMPTPGASGSLGANKNIVIDGVRPTVSNVTSPTANGTYNVNDTIVVWLYQNSGGNLNTNAANNGCNVSMTWVGP